MRLIYTNQEGRNGQEVKIGDVVKDFRGEALTVTGITRPHHGGSTGRVSVDEAADDEGNVWHSQYFPSVIGAEWIERGDQGRIVLCDVGATFIVVRCTGCDARFRIKLPYAPPLTDDNFGAWESGQITDIEGAHRCAVKGGK